MSASVAAVAIPFRQSEIIADVFRKGDDLLEGDIPQVEFLSGSTYQDGNPPSFLSCHVTAARRFHRYPTPQHASELTVICGGWEECSADYVIDRKNFPYFSFEFVASGEGELNLQGQKTALIPGSIFTYGPGVSQQIRTSTQHRLRKYFVDFSGKRAEGLMRQCGLEPGTATRLTASTEVRHAFDTLIRLGDSAHGDPDDVCSLQLELLLRLTTRSAAPASTSDRRSLATFERCRQKIDSDFLLLRTVEDAARSCHVDVSYLCRLFRRFHGEKPLHYLQFLQMHWAARRLRDSKSLIRQVADELGLEAFQLSRTFKRIHGVSPTEYLNANA